MRWPGLTPYSGERGRVFRESRGRQSIPSPTTSGMDHFTLEMFAFAPAGREPSRAGQMSDDA